MNASDSLPASSSRFRRIGRNLARAAVWTPALALAGLAAIELFLRATLPPTYGRIPFDRGMSLYLTDDSREHPFSAGATNELRVAVIGDSVAMGAGVQRYAAVGPALEVLLNLNAGPPPVRVDVYARPSAAYEQVRLVRKALANGARVVVLACCLNDAEDWAEGLNLVRRRPDTAEPEPPAWARFLVARTFTGRLLFDRLDQRRRDRDFRRYYEYLYAPGYSGLDKFRAAVAEMADLCRAGGAQLVGMLFPLLNQDLRPEAYRPYARMHAVVRGFFDAAGVPFLDLHPAFARADPVRVQNIPRLDPHPNEIGHRLAAETLFEFLLERGLLPAAYRPHGLRDPHLVNGWKKKLRAYGQPLPE